MIELIPKSNSNKNETKELKDIEETINNGNYKLEEILGGYSGEKLYKLSTSQKNYCIKTTHDIKLKIKNLEEICETYKRLNIDSIDILGYGTKDNIDFYIYRYIEGDNLKSVSNSWNDLTKIYEVGFEIGKRLRRLKEHPVKSNTTINNQNIDKITIRINELYTEILNNKYLLNIMNDYFDIKQIESLIKSCNKCNELFKSIPKNLIHGDIKRSNIIVDTTGKYILIDIESMKNSYDILSFRHQMTWMLISNKTEGQFLKGYFDGLYNNTRPDNFYEQIIYITTLNFIEVITKIYKDEERLKKYLNNMKEVFYNINKLIGDIS